MIQFVLSDSCGGHFHVPGTGMLLSVRDRLVHSSLHLLQSQRRRAQNRESQRAFRVRQQDAIKQISAKRSAMEQELKRMHQLNQDLTDEISTLRQKIQMREREYGKFQTACLSMSSTRSSLLPASSTLGQDEGNKIAAMANGCL